MKIGINSWTLPTNLTIEETFKVAKEAGFETIELNMAEDVKHETIVSELGLEDSPHVTLKMKADELQAIKQLADQYELPISSVATALHWKYPLNSPDPTIREQGKEVARRMIDACQIFGGDTVLIVPGIVTADNDYETCYRLAQEGLRELAPYAEAKGIVIGVENVWNKFLYSPLEMRQFIDEINHPFIKIYFDAGNVLQFGFPHQWVSILGERIAKVHVKDFNTTVGNITGFTNLLAGDLDWPRLMSALKESGYDGPITAELSPYKEAPLQLAKDTMKAIDIIINLA
ncbi:TIM barrel protein [Vagococcus sp. BWB3-3]|uniref:TIM barrel protein n=1 Tax=Vagococcus allomyrinae TaxID=2794353 RepID=A0A940P7W4_9ENTE|nr:sugar phosphate isomerase/epimerase family protein [Vagococcus allomyrinae]MBP1043012.1 TIM barrel protein [Vagococcus allomyrinae]